MKKISILLKPAISTFIIMTVLCGIIYPAVVTAIAQAVFPAQANGSILTIVAHDGERIDAGSSLIGQEFTDPGYLIGRPAGVSNLSPVSEEQMAVVRARIDWWHSMDPTNKQDIPMDLVTASGSGVDPNISPEAAAYQIGRIAKARNINEDTARDIIKKNTSGRLLGFWGEPAVNVLKVNLALDDSL
jgi:potassium-transporting ATPase KdpC subunit